MNTMDTAPRDGTRFMAKWPEDDGDPEEWAETWYGKPDWAPREGWTTGDWWADLFAPYAPTEWRPL